MMLRLKCFTDLFRRIEEFSEIFQYSLFTLFVWIMLSQASILLTLQFQMVEFHSFLSDNKKLRIKLSKMNLIKTFFPPSKLDENAKLVETVIIVITIYWMYGINFLVCEPGERMTAQFEMFGEELNRCDWYLLSTEMQQIYLIFMVDAQQLKNIQCYGGIRCTRDTLKQVRNLRNT